MREEMLEKKLARERQRVMALEKMIEDGTRTLYLSKERFREQSEFLNHLIESLPHPFYVIDADDYTIKVANSAARAGDMSGEVTCFELTHKKSIPCEDAEHPCPLKDVIRTGKPVTAEHVHYDKFNDRRIFEVHGFPVFNGDGKVVQMIEYSLDVTERKASDEKIMRQVEKLAALRSIDTAISGSMDLSLTLKVIIEIVADQLKTDAADILLYRPHLQTLEYGAGYGFKTRALRYTRLRIGESNAGRAALERSTVHIPDLRKEADGFKKSKYMEDEGFITYYSVPLIAKGGIKGVLEVFNRTVMDPDHEWIDFLNALAGQTAIAIDNSTLFEGLQRSNIDIVMAYDETIEGWSRALDLRDKETEGHSRRVTELTLRIAQAMGIGEAEQAEMRRGALLHDIGKMGIPDHILLKPGPLDDEEWEIMRKHPVFGFELLSPINFLRTALDIPYCHHEKWDGTGYPRGLKGEQIPLAARVFAAVDIYDALISERPYRPPWPREKVLEHISSLAGSHLDPKVAAVFLEMDKETTT